jgi:ABC-type multidrug transport system fused ATPase/permease subunit
MSRRSADRAWQTVNEVLKDRDAYQPGTGWSDVKRLWRDYLSKQSGVMILTAILTVLLSGVPFAFPMTWRFLVDDVLRINNGSVPPDAVSHHTWLVLVFCVINSLLWTTELSGTWAVRRLLAGIGRNLAYRLRGKLHRKLQVLHIGFFDRTPVGIIMSRVLDDVNVIHMWTTRGTRMILSCLLKIPIAICLLLYLRWDLAIMVALTIPLYVLSYLHLRPIVRKCHSAMRRLNSKKYALCTERVGAVKVVKALSREVAETRTLARMSHDSVRVALHLVIYRQVLAITVAAITALSTGMVIFLGAAHLRAGTMSLGDVLAFLSTIRLLLFPVKMLTNVATNIQRFMVVLRRVFSLLDEPVEVKSGHISLDGMTSGIEFDNVTFAHPTQTAPALKDISFSIKPGERIALMGPSGSGKSTVFQLLTRFYDPTEGTARVGGVDLTQADTASLRDHVRMVEQEPVIFSGSITENISYGKLEASAEEIEKAAQQAELHEFAQSLPAGYDTIVGENGVTLSGGQKQRLALATALLTDPEVLLMDDTTSALDPATEMRIHATLDHVLQNRTSLIITQRIASAEPCDRILVVENGHLTQQGTHAELSKQPGFYRDICVEQGIVD